MSELVGKTLGKYRVVARLGGGGFAEVFKAYQPGLDRHVAIKILQSHVAAQQDSASRFEREAVAVARLRHPNIVQVHDFDALGEMRYMVMEFIDGPDLHSELDERRAKNQPFSLLEITRIFDALTGAVDYAHTQGIVHHDLKPDNVMITPDGQVVLTDFGVAQMKHLAQHTVAGTVSGTPAYMAPEQARGERGDARSDIYSLGIMLYEMVTGRTPFQAENVITLITMHIKELPPPPSTIKSDVPDAVERIILKALEKKPEARYQTAGELGAALWIAGGTALEVSTPITLNALAPARRISEVALTPDRPPLSTGAPIPPCPYRGLFAFREKDAPFFFGREAFTVQLVEAVQQQSLVAVLGPSGSGKSSVVNAGLIPRLRQTTASSPVDNWHIASFRPGDRPFHTLAAALLPYLQSGLSTTDSLVESNKLGEALGKGETHLTEIIARLVEQHHQADAQSRLLLVIDQFEELYTLCPQPRLRHHFLDELLKAVEAGRAFKSGVFTHRSATVTRLPVSIVLTMRADFLAQALTHRDFADALQAADIKLGPMTRQELERAVENPAGRQGVLFEKGLAARILDDVGEEVGRLPLLEFALTSLWDKQQGGLLTHEAYEASGRVEGALAYHANEVFNALNPAEQIQARQIFIQLVRPGEGTEDTRRLAARAELGEANWALVQRLADARLVVTGRNSAGQETTEVVHEALIRGWEQLRSWMSADRTFRAWQERLRQALQQWQASGQDEGALLRGTLLAEAEGWLHERKNNLSQAEQSFIQAGVALRERQKAAQERQRRRVMAGLATGLIITAIGLVLMVGLAGMAGLNWRSARQAQTEAIAAAERADAEAQRAEGEAQRAEDEAQRAEAAAAEAEQQRRTAFARQLMGQADGLAAVQPDLALLLSLEAARIDPHLQQETRHSLLTALETNPRLTTYLRGHLGDVEDVAFSPDGKILASAGTADEAIILWDIETGQPLGRPLAGHTAHVLTVAFSPDGKLLASGGDDKTVILWDVQTGRLLERLTGPTEWVRSVAFNRNGTLLASAGGGQKIIIWDVQSRRQLGSPLEGHTNGVRRVVFSPTNDTTLASAGDDHTIILWDVAARQQLGTLNGHTDWVLGLAFNPDGQTLASGSRDNTIILWDLTRRPYPQRGQPLAAHTNSVLGVAFSLDGQTLASSSWDKTVRLWDVRNPDDPAPLGAPLSGHSDGVFSLTFNPQNGQQLVSAGADDTIIVWNLAARQRLSQPLAQQPGDVETVAFSPDGKLLASGGNDNKIILWDMVSRKPRGQPLSSHTDWVTNIIFSPAGKILASAGRDSRVILWDVASGQPVTTLAGHSDGVWSIAFSPDGSKLATGGVDQTIILWDVETFQQLGQFRGHSDRVSSLAFSPNGQTLASAGWDKSIILWDVETFQPLGLPLTGHTDQVFAVAFSPDSQTLVSGGRDSAIIFWNVTDRNNPSQIGPPLLEHTNSVLGLTFNRDGTTLASSSFDTTILLWDMTDINNPVPKRSPLEGHTDAIDDLAFNPDGTTLASGSRDGTIRVWDIQTGRPVGEPLIGHRSAVRSVALSPDGQTLAWGSADYTITLWDLTSGSRIGQPLAGHTDWVNGLAFNPKNKILASAGGDETIILWDVATGRQIGEPVVAHQSWTDEIFFSPDGTMLASVGGDNIVRLWDVTAKDLQLRSEFSRHTDEVNDVVFSPDGQFLASAGDDKTIFLWDIAGGKPLAKFDQGRRNDPIEGAVGSLAFSPDGRALAGGYDDFKIRLWDIETGQQLGRSLIGHSGWIGDLAFSPDGTMIASASSVDKSIRLWDVAGGQPLGPPLLGHTADVQSLTFSPDGQTLISGGDDGLVIRWNLDPAFWPALACGVAARNLTWEEWQQYLGSEPYRSTCPDSPLYLAAIYLQADVYAQAGQPEQAQVVFEQAAQAAVNTDIGALNNNTCWWGSLAGLAEVVLPACERAVELAAKDEVGFYQDTRGLARALTGDHSGALQDFEAFMQWSRENPGPLINKQKVERQRWINVLKEGRNPFDETTLEALRNE